MSDNSTHVPFSKAAKKNEPMEPSKQSDEQDRVDNDKHQPPKLVSTRPTEYGGQKGPEPTRFGDWEKNGRCTDF